MSIQILSMYKDNDDNDEKKNKKKFVKRWGSSNAYNPKTMHAIRYGIKVGATC